jgi:hypothetical protein
VPENLITQMRPRDRGILKDRHVRIIIACPENVFLHYEAEYIYADCPFAQLQTSCSSAADHTLSVMGGFIKSRLKENIFVPVIKLTDSTDSNNFN